LSSPTAVEFQLSSPPVAHPVIKITPAPSKANYSPGYGQVADTVPGMADFIERQNFELRNGC
jgi:hypothetical protein